MNEFIIQKDMEDIFSRNIDWKKLDGKSILLTGAYGNLYPEKKLKVIRKQRDKSEHYTENTLLVGKTNIPDNTKLKQLGWEPRVDIKDGFKRVINYLADTIDCH